MNKPLWPNRPRSERLTVEEIGLHHVQQTTWSIPRTTPFEQFLLFMSVLILPLQDHFPSVAGMSVMFLIFAVLGIYVILNRGRILGQTWCHPVFIAAYAFIGVCSLLEVISPASAYLDIIRFGQMIAGAVCVAVLCRDRSALVAVLYGYVAAALWVSVLLCSSTYGALQDMGELSDFEEAEKVRGETFGSMSIGASINGMAYVSAEGAIVAFAAALSEGLKYRRILWFGISMFCLVASFLPMSRGTVAVCIVAFATILYGYGIKHAKTLILVSILGVGIYMLVPDAVWSRMVFHTGSQGNTVDSRSRLYTKAFNRLPEYIVAGVGSGNFWHKWGFEKGFGVTKQGRDFVKGVHNSLLQIMICWGVLGLSMFMWIMWLVYRAIPFGCGRDWVSLAMLGIVVSLGPLLLQQHNYYEKPFALGLGLAVGARQWIWPTGIVPEVVVNNRPSRAKPQTANLGGSKG